VITMETQHGNTVWQLWKHNMETVCGNYRNITWKHYVVTIETNNMETLCDNTYSSKYKLVYYTCINIRMTD